MRSPSVSLALVSAVVSLALPFALPLHGHGPGVIDRDVVEVDDPTLSWVFPGHFDTGDEVFTLLLDFPDEGFAFPIEVLVPHQVGLEEHRPAIAVIAAGLPPPTEAQRAAVPGGIPDGLGVIVDDNSVDPRPVLFEGFMRRVYWTSGPLAVAVDRGVTEVRIWSPAGTAGKFAIGFGVEEDFGADSFPPILEHWNDFAY